MAPEEDVKRRLARRLGRRAHQHHHHHKDPAHLSTMDMPARFRDDAGDDDADDTDEDCAAPPPASPYLNQSIFGMIAAAGSQIDFNARFDEQSSEDEDAVGNGRGGSGGGDRSAGSRAPADDDKAAWKLSQSRLLRTIPRRAAKTKRGSSLAEGTSAPAAETVQDTVPPSLEPPEVDVEEVTTSQLDQTPVLGRMLEAQAELASRTSSTEALVLPPGELVEGEPAQGATDGPAILANKLAEIFHFDRPEQVVAEYPCWLLKSVLLSGYMYITTRHICFYAYLPKASNEVVKSGYLSKSGRRNPKYNRYWFRLKGDVLSYYVNPSDLYFPSGNIDLRYGISASLADKSKDAKEFIVVTHQRKYHLRADSAPSAKEWVKALQKIIFRSLNEGDSVKVSLPVKNVIDIEDSKIVDFADTCKIRVIENDETFAIDEYFFSFFSSGKQALDALRATVEESIAQQAPDRMLKSPPMNTTTELPQLDSNGSTGLQKTGTVKKSRAETIMASISPLLGGSTIPRVDAAQADADGSPWQSDTGRAGRHGFADHDAADVVRGRTASRPSQTSRSRTRASSTSRIRSLSMSRLLKKGDGRSSDINASSESYVQSMDEPASLAAIASADEDTQASASQILQGSEVFRAPTITPQVTGPRAVDANSDRLDDGSRKTPLMGFGTEETVRSDAHMRQTDPQSHHAPTTDPTLPGQSIHSILKVGSYPLQRAVGIVDYVNKHSKRMSNLLATESMGYVEKVSGMWKGEKKHYENSRETLTGEADMDDDDADASGERFREHFALPSSEKLQAAYYGYLHRVLPLYGKIYVSNKSFCFRSLLPGTRTKLILPLKDVETVNKEKGFRFGYSGLVVVIRGHEELFFDFAKPEHRDDCAVTALSILEVTRYLRDSEAPPDDELEVQGAATNAEHRALSEARQQKSTDGDPLDQRFVEDAKIEHQDILFDDSRASVLSFKPKGSLRFTCLTIGSRGDVQPYIALCKGLLTEGHHARIATHVEFQPWIESHGIEFRPVAGDPAELMQLCIEHGTFTYSFIRAASTKFRGWIDNLLSTAWHACQDSDVLLESPTAMAGIHIAEALQIPYWRSFSMPWTRTRAYPHALIVPDHKMGGAYNYLTYIMWDNVFWKATAGQINRWRKKELGLPPTNLEKMQPNKVPFVYAYSPSVVVPPLDYSDWVRVTGYWFLHEGGDFTPPQALVDFIHKARQDGKKLVYVGFGSIIVRDAAALTQTVVKSVLKADVRCILSKGWSDRLQKEDKPTGEAIVLPPEIYQVSSVPHDWLFRQIDAVAHHGGAGTTGASLRAGRPTIIKPFFGDQYFFGARVEDLGVGILMKKLNVSVFSRALWEACHSERMVVKARNLGEQIRRENGVETAIQSIYRDMEYAKSLIKGRPGGDGKATAADDALDDSEESWTFVGDEQQHHHQIQHHPPRPLQAHLDMESGRRVHAGPDRVSDGEGEAEGDGHRSSHDGDSSASVSLRSLDGAREPGGGRGDRSTAVRAEKERA